MSIELLIYNRDITVQQTISFGCWFVAGDILTGALHIL